MAQTPHRSTSRVLDIFDLLSTTMEGFTLTEIAQPWSAKSAGCCFWAIEAPAQFP